MISRLSLIVRYVLFCLFFTVGAGAITLSILIDPEISTYFRNRQMLEEIQRENDKIIDLTSQYQAQIDLIRSEPNVLARLGRVTFGNTFAADDTQGVSPTLVDNEALRQAAQSVLDEIENKPVETALPHWFQRCLDFNTRTALFAAGAGLVLITFLFFGSPGVKTNTLQKPFQRQKHQTDEYPER